jgi:hypothetical protein
MSKSRNYTIPSVHSQLLFNRSGVKFKSSIPTKIIITQNDRTNSDFCPGMAVLGFKLRLSCYAYFSVNLKMFLKL